MKELSELKNLSLRYFLKNWGTSEIFTHFSLTSFNLWMTACVSCFIADRRRGETSLSEFSENRNFNYVLAPVL